MFRKMRRNKQEMTPEESMAVLEKGTSGVLAVIGDEDYPYAVPLSYVYDAEAAKLYFHCAVSGHKLDAVKKNPKVSFCVIDKDQIVPQEYTTYYRSVIIFGRMRVIEDEAEGAAAAEKLGLKYAPDDTEEHRKEVIKEGLLRMCMLELSIEHMSGKEAVEIKKESSGKKAVEIKRESDESIK